jgi:hypothetical protein
MAEISKPHEYVDPRLKPGAKDFRADDLSAALQMTTGTLKVEGYFEGKPPEVQFSTVTAGPQNNPIVYGPQLWSKKIANRLLWEVPLDPGQRSVTLRITDWEGKRAQYVFKAPHDRNEIEITIAHTEVEVPLFFLKDPPIPEEIRSLPDPDFEMFYGLSSFTDPTAPWPVPVPKAVTPAGTTEKPCTGGMFTGFGS